MSIKLSVPFLFVIFALFPSPYSYATNLKMPPVEKNKDVEQGEEELPVKKKTPPPKATKNNESTEKPGHTPAVVAPSSTEHNGPSPKSQGEHPSAPSVDPQGHSSGHDDGGSHSVEGKEKNKSSDSLTETHHEAEAPKGKGPIWFAIVFIVLMVVIFAFT